MIETLRLRGLGVIEDAELEFRPGLNVITGETGAGKTLLLAGLDLLLGGRADPGVVRGSAAEAEGRWLVPDDGPVAHRVREAGGFIDAGELVIARVVPVAGRSRAVAGGRTVPQGVLAELAGELVVVHGQNDQLRLRRESQQRRALDQFGGAEVEDLLERYRERYQECARLEAELAEITASGREHQALAAMYTEGLAEIDALAPTAGEDAEIAQNIERLAHADQLYSAAQRARSALAGGDDDRDGLSALDSLSGAVRSLESAAGHDELLAGLAGRVRECAVIAAELGSELSAYLDGLDADPAALAKLEERKAELARLVRKHGPGLDDVLAWAEQARSHLGLFTDPQRPDRLRSGLQAVRDEATVLAAKLSAARAAAAAGLAERMSQELAELAMPDAKLEVAVTGTGDLGPDGADQVQFRFAAHRGAAPAPLGRGASGGELSRVMLALEVCLSGSDPAPTFLFDEIDAGVGGKAAVEIGRRLQRLAQHTQVIAVTHLPQVAAFADHHLVISKSASGSVTTAAVHAAIGPQRVRELARMLAGQEDSEHAAAHARELLELGQAGREDGEYQAHADEFAPWQDLFAEQRL